MSELRSAVESLRVEVLPDLPDARIEEDFSELQRVSELLEIERLRRLAELERRRLFERDGHLSAASWLASTHKLSWGAARDHVRTARALEEIPETRRALEAGDLSMSAVRVLITARDADPEAFGRSEAQLVETARIHSMHDLQTVVAHWRQGVEREQAADGEERMREHRKLHASVSFLGMVRVDGDLDPETGETLLTALGAVLDAGSRSRENDDIRTPAQRRADALGEICRQWLDRSDRPIVAGERPHVTVTVAAEGLRHEQVTTSELDHAGPVQPGAARRMACDASIMRVVMSGSSQPLDVGRRIAVIPPAMRRAVMIRDRHCRSRVATDRTRGAMPTTSSTGPTAGRQHSPTCCCCAGGTTDWFIDLAASDWSCWKDGPCSGALTARCWTTLPRERSSLNSTKQPCHTRMVTSRISSIFLLALVGMLAPATSLAATSSPELVAGDLSFPSNMAFAPDGRLVFAEKDTGDIRVIQDGRLLTDPIAQVDVLSSAEQGLLGLALDPAFDVEPWIYVYYSDPVARINRLARFRTGGGSSELQPLLMGLTTERGYHNGGDIVFGGDGKLYVSVGEVHEGERAQDPNDIGGKILRLNPDGTVPSDNPFGVGNPAFSMGHRNSFGLCFDPSNGDLWETENGPGSDDEVNLIEPGGNYGWPDQLGPGGEPAFIDPVLDFPDVIVPTGCAVWRGDLYFGAYGTGQLYRLPLPSAPDARALVVRDMGAGVTDLEVGPDGDLYVATSEAIWRLDTPGSPEATATDAPVPGDPADGGSNTALVIVAGIVLAAGLAARVIAGRRLRRDVSER